MTKEWTHVKVLKSTKEKLRNLQRLRGETFDTILSQMFDEELYETTK